MLYVDPPGLSTFLMLIDGRFWFPRALCRLCSDFYELSFGFD